MFERKSLSFSAVWTLVPLFLSLSPREKVDAQQFPTNQVAAFADPYPADDVDRFVGSASDTPAGRHSAISGDRLNQIGILLYKRNRYLDSVRIFEKALQLYETNADTAGEATVLNEIAMCRDSLGEKQLASESLQKALEKWRQLQDRDNEVSTLGKQGDLYRTWCFPDRALRFYRKAAALFPISRDTAIQAGVQNNMGLAYLDMRDWKRSAKCFRAALDLYRSVANADAEAITLINLGSALNQAHETAKALEVLNRALDIARNLNDETLIAGSLNGIGQAYAGSGDHGRALASLKSALAAFEEVGNAAGSAAVQRNISLLQANEGR